MKDFWIPELGKFWSDACKGERQWFAETFDPEIETDFGDAGWDLE